ncbi:MAG: MaoC/PaaZ C-terminal domain-containing protein [Chloroflexi bacterium]|nr:MaoC/PaaZ C-terminal domain-containing protein [Chloroflexota bacterium]
MPNQIFWEDVIDGMELPSLVKNPTTRQLVQYAGASGDFYEIHYDKDFAQETGLSGVIIHGALKSAFLGQLMTDWIGPLGTLKRLSCQYRGMDYPNQPITAKGTVTRKYQEGEQNLVDCTIWLENPAGENTTPGTATVVLPSRTRNTQ